MSIPSGRQTLQQLAVLMSFLPMLPLTAPNTNVVIKKTPVSLLLQSMFECDNYDVVSTMR